MQNDTAPYRADEVGSLLRTQPFKEARAKCEKGANHPRPARKGRGRGDQEDHQEAGGGRPAARHRRRVPPLLVALRLLLEAHGLRARGARSRHPVPRRPDQAREPEGHGQAGFPRRPPHARALQVPQGQHQGHAEDDHSLALGDALPRRPQCHQQAGLSRHGRLLRRPRQGLRQGDQGLLRCRLPLPAARRHGVGLFVLREGEGGGEEARRGRRQAARRSTPRSSTRRSSPSPPT